MKNIRGNKSSRFVCSHRNGKLKKQIKIGILCKFWEWLIGSRIYLIYVSNLAQILSSHYLFIVFLTLCTPCAT